MPIVRPTATLVAKAWHSVKDEWITRHEYEGTRRWSVVHNWGGNVIADETMKIVSRHYTQEAAEKRAFNLEAHARAAAVLKALGIADQDAGQQ